MKKSTYRKLAVLAATALFSLGGVTSATAATPLDGPVEIAPFAVGGFVSCYIQGGRVTAVGTLRSPGLLIVRAANTEQQVFGATGRSLTVASNSRSGSWEVFGPASGAGFCD